MRALALAVAIAVLPLPLAAGNGVLRQDPALTKIEIGSFCQVRSIDSVEAPDTYAQRVDLLEITPEIRWPGPVVPLLPGLSFGIRSETGGVLIEDVTIELSHPAFLGSGMTHQSYVTSLGGSDASINAYSFDLPEEMVTGTWTFRASTPGGTLYEVRFEVVPPGMLPEVGRDCGKDFIS